MKNPESLPQKEKEFSDIINNDSLRDIVFTILSFLPKQDLTSVATVSEKLKMLVENYMIRYASLPKRIKSELYQEKASIKKIKNTEKLYWENNQSDLGALSKLPNEIITKTFSFLSAQELDTVVQTCKFFEVMAEDDILWKELLKDWQQKQTIPTKAKVITTSTYKQLYKTTVTHSLQAEFTKLFPWVELKTPSVDPPKNSFFKNKEIHNFEKTLYEGTSAEITITVTNANNKWITPDLDKDYLIYLINLTLNNHQENAFKAFIEAMLKIKNNPIHILYIREVFYDSSKGYILLNLIKQNLALPINGMPLIFRAIFDKKEKKSTWVIGLLLAFDIRCVSILNAEKLTPGHLFFSLTDSRFDEFMKLFFNAIKIYNKDIFFWKDENYKTIIHYIIDKIDKQDMWNFINWADFDKNQWLNTLTKNGSSFLFYSVATHNNYAFNFFMRHCGNELITVVNNDGNTVLHLLSSDPSFKSFINPIMSLTKISEILETPNSKGETPIMLAIRSQNSWMVDKLLSQGANPEIALNYYYNLYSTEVNLAPHAYILAALQKKLIQDLQAENNRLKQENKTLLQRSSISEITKVEDDDSEHFLPGTG